MSTAVRYALFAAIATAVNLGAQALVQVLIREPIGLYIAILVGTIVGLICKYLLDKRWIFRFTSRSHTHELRTFVMYGLFSVVTTIIFWAFELGFLFLFQSEVAQYVGAALGLAIGYTAKYGLDKGFTFVPPRNGKAS